MDKKKKTIKYTLTKINLVNFYQSFFCHFPNLNESFLVTTLSKDCSNDIHIFDDLSHQLKNTSFKFFCHEYRGVYRIFFSLGVDSIFEDLCPGAEQTKWLGGRNPY